MGMASKSASTMRSVTVFPPQPPKRDYTLHLPRILCLHGGGTNARIFKAQCRQLSAELRCDFRFVYAEGPWESEAGPDVVAVYGEWGPFKRWLRWSLEHPEITTEETVQELDKSLSAAVAVDDDNGATGEVVAVLGFSQGAKVAASLLYLQQVTGRSLGLNSADSKYRFGVLLAGSAPLVDLDLDGWDQPAAPDTQKDHDTLGPRPLKSEAHKLKVPTLHVHGLWDRGLGLHQKLLEEFCESQSTMLVEWKGEHRVILKRKDVLLVGNHIRKLANLSGIQ